MKLRYYFENETQTVITLEDVKNTYNELQSEGEWYACHYSFSDYLSMCMYWNNGSLTPLGEYINELNRELASCERLYHDIGYDNSEEIDELKTQIADYELLYAKEIESIKKGE